MAPYGKRVYMALCLHSFEEYLLKRNVDVQTHVESYMRDVLKPTDAEIEAANRLFKGGSNSLVSKKEGIKTEAESTKMLKAAKNALSMQFKGDPVPAKVLLMLPFIQLDNENLVVGSTKGDKEKPLVFRIRENGGVMVAARQPAIIQKLLSKQYIKDFVLASREVGYALPDEVIDLDNLRNGLNTVALPKLLPGDTSGSGNQGSIAAAEKVTALTQKEMKEKVQEADAKPPAAKILAPDADEAGPSRLPTVAPPVTKPKTSKKKSKKPVEVPPPPKENVSQELRADTPEGQTDAKSALADSGPPEIEAAPLPHSPAERPTGDEQASRTVDAPTEADDDEYSTSSSSIAFEAAPMSDSDSD